MSDKEAAPWMLEAAKEYLRRLRTDPEPRAEEIEYLAGFIAKHAVECTAPAPQPAESIDCYVVFNSGFMQQSFADEATAEEYAEAKFSDSPEVEIKKMRLVEVRRASPQPADEAKRLIHKAVMALSGEVSGRKIADALLALADLRELVELAATPQVTPTKPTITLEVYQHDWLPGFASFHSNGERAEGATKHIVLNIGSLLCAVESGDLPKQDLPYMIAESLMHETVHALEEWAGVEFSEERVEELLTKYRAKYARATIWEYTGSEPKEPAAASPRESIFICGKCKKPLIYSCDCPPIQAPEGLVEGTSEQASPTTCKSPYHRPTSMFCLDCIPPDAPISVLLLSNRKLTKEETMRGLDIAKLIEQASPTPDKCPKCNSADRSGHIVAWAGLEAVYCPDSWHSSTAGEVNRG